MIEAAVAVYILCALASLACAALLLRGYRRSRVKLLLWSGLCFACFFVNNVVLVIDVRLLPEHDLSIIRTLPSVLGIALLLYGLIWESDR